MNLSKLRLVLGALVLVLSACGPGSPEPSAPAPAGPAAAALGAVTIQVSLAAAPQLMVAAVGAASPACTVRIVTPRQATRRIEPGDFPDGFVPEDPVALPGGGWRVGGLPIGENLLVQVSFRPGMDLRTGEALAAGAGAPALVHFPVVVPASGSLALDIQLRLQPNPAGGYFLDGRLSSDNQAGVLALRLDYHAGTVARDSNGDGQFTDEPQLADPQQLGVSPVLLARLAAENSAGRAMPTLFTALVEQVDEAAGELHVSGLQLPAAGSSSGAQTLRFAEDTNFSARHVTLAAETTGQVAPPALAAGSRIIVSAASLPGADGTATLWVERAVGLQLDLPPDSVVAVPLKQSVLAGELVPVTVYANRTAHPLHSVDRLSISFDAADRYVPGSLDPGDIGGGPDLADGLWTGLLQPNFILHDAARSASATEPATKAYAELSLTPGATAEVVAATGALCNFTLVCHADTELGVLGASAGSASTTYSGLNGLSAQWTNCLTSAAPQVAVAGQPVLLQLANPPKLGRPGFGPYIVAPGTLLHFTLSGPTGADVTHSPLTRFTLTRSGAPPELLPDGDYCVPADYAGPLHVAGRYDQVYCRPNTEVELYVEDTSRLALAVSDSETTIAGGHAAGWRLGTDSGLDGLHVQLFPQAGVDLHALYFDLTYDPQLYRPINCWVPGDFGALTLAPPSVALERLAEPGRLRWGMCQIHPAAASGYTGDQALLEVQFERLKIDAPVPPPQPPAAPAYPCALLSADTEHGALAWQAFVAGDFNQDGRVELSTGGSTDVGDWTMLCLNLGAAGFAPDSPADVIDRVWDERRQAFNGGDGVVDTRDGQVVATHLGEQVDAWRVCCGAQRATYPDGGAVLAEVPYSAGTLAAGNARRSFSWSPPGGLAPGCYWIVPVCATAAGAPSQPVTVQ